MVNEHMLYEGIEIVRNGILDKIEVDGAVIFKEDGVVKVFLPFNKEHEKYHIVKGSRGYGRTHFLMNHKKCKWTPCSEQEPPKDGLYLVSGYWLKSKKKVVVTCEYFGEWKCAYNFIIEAWMELPDSYTKE